MTARYIPPHARNVHQTATSIDSTAQHVSPHLQNGKANQSLGDLGQDRFQTVREIEQYFWPNGNANLKIEESSCEDPKDEGIERGNSGEEKHSNGTLSTEDNDGKTDQKKRPFSRSHATLSASAAHPNILSFVLVFDDAHPRWKHDKIIFAKSNLHLLPADQPEVPTPGSSNGGFAADSDADVSGAVTREKVPIAVFHNFNAPKGHQDRMEFDAWYRVSRVQILAPRTAELERMLEQKFSLLRKKYGQDAKKKKFEQKLDRQWAVVKLEKDVQANLKLGKPIIPTLEVKEGRGLGEKPLGSTQSLGVNELLRLLRLGDETAKTDMHDGVQEGAQDTGGGHKAAPEGARGGVRHDTREGAQGSQDANGDAEESILNSTPNGHGSPDVNEKGPDDGDDQKEIPKKTAEVTQNAYPVKSEKYQGHKNITTNGEPQPAKRSTKLDPTVPSFVPKSQRDNV